MENIKEEMMTEEETQALTQKLASLNFEQALAVIDSVSEEENAHELIAFMMAHFNPKVALALGDMSIRELIARKFIEVLYDENGIMIGFKPTFVPTEGTEERVEDAHE